MSRIVLATLNARYSHASLGLRCLRANLGDLRAHTRIVEMVAGVKTESAVERLLALRPRVVGFGVYVWNVEETARIVAMLKVVAPDIVVVVGGPEVSFETDRQRVCALADYVVTGWGEVTFAALVRQILSGPRPLMKVHAGVQPPLDELALPYGEYTEEDIARRHLYVEASRGCPFKCEFCLSALDRTAWPFDLARFLGAIDALWRRGARTFRFVDRTFNLNVSASLAILEFFLARLRADPADPCFVHFEVVPDHLPDALKEAVARFPPGSLQLELGIQSFNPEVQGRVSRRQDNERACANLRWLRQASAAHLHVDLIAGLPGETVESFAAGFDRLWALGPHEIQVGILKRLRGAPIIRHTEAHRMRYNPEAPYNVLATDAIDFPTMQRLARFARYWDMVANSGRFQDTLPLLVSAGAGASPFAGFMAWSDWLYATAGQTHELAMERLFGLLHAFLLGPGGLEPARAEAALLADYARAGGRGTPGFIRAGAPAGVEHARARRVAGARTPERQARHLAAAGPSPGGAGPSR